MLHKCANPVCSSLFRSLSLGKLFLLDNESDPESSAARESGVAPAIRRGRSVRQMERYWLCDSCASLLTLTFERGRGMVTVPLPAIHLTRAQPTAKMYRTELKGAL